MRAFRFRFDPVMRIKRYSIERKEEEIAALEAQIQRLLHEIEDGRRAVQDMRRRLLEEVDDTQWIQEELSLDLFRNYTNEVERQKREEIDKIRKDQDKKKQELIELYQEEKILERLKERRLAEWRAEMQRHEGYLMDEIGAQNYARHKHERGGILFYLMVLMALAVVGAAIGLYTGVIDKQILANVPYLGDHIRSATAPIPLPTPTLVPESLTIGEFIGDPDEPMSEQLQNLSKERENIRQTIAQLNERERLLNERESRIDAQQAELSDLVKQVTDAYTALQELETLREEREKSELSEREQQMATAVAGMKPKEAAPLLINLFDTVPVLTPEEAADPILKEKAEKKNQFIVLRILNRIENREEIFSALSKTNPQSAADIVKAYIETSKDELYDIEPPPTPSMNPGAAPGTPPSQQTFGNPQPGG